METLKKNVKSRDYWTLGYGNTLQIIVKVSERCNLACDYCYFFYGGDESYKEHSPIISASTVKATVSYLVQAVEELSLKEVVFILHGGEPLMMKKTRFVDLCQQLRDALDPITELRIDLQTNAVLIDDEWIGIFQKYQVGVGVSVDGPKIYNDQHRIDKRGRGTHDKVVTGINLVKQAVKEKKLGGIGAINVVNPHYDGRLVYDHLTKELGITTTHFLLPDQHHANTDLNDIPLYRNYLLSLLNAWLEDERGEVDVRFFTQIIKRLMQRRFERDYVNPVNTHRNIVLAMSSDGEIGPDDTLRTTDPKIMQTGLFVHNSTVLDAVIHPQIALMKQLINEIPDGCLECEWANVCRGGIEPIHNFTGVGSTYYDQFQAKSVYCEALIEFFEKLSISLLKSGDFEAVIEEALS